MVRRSARHPKRSATGRRTAWHVLFERLVIQRAPTSVEVQIEVPLGRSRPQLDILLLRRIQGASADADANVLRGLWAHLVRVMVLEFKSASHPLRPGDLFRLLSYANLYAADTLQGDAEGMSVGLVVGSVTPSLDAELAAVGGHLPVRENGYAVVKLRPFELLVAVVDEVAEAERDELLGCFGHQHLHQIDDILWWERENGHVMTDIKDLPEYDQVLAKLYSSLRPEGLRKALPQFDPEHLPEILADLKPEQRLAGLKPEQRLAGLQPEQRLAGLQPEQRLAGLKDEEAIQILLRRLPKDMAATFSAELKALR